MAWQKFKEKPQDTHANNLQLLKDRIKSKSVSGAYIFYGDEEYTKNHYEKLLTKEAGSKLNVTSFYGSDFNLTDFISACETSAVESFDMFSMQEDEAQDNDDGSFRVIKVYLKAEKQRICPDLAGMPKKDCDFLLEFLSDLPEKTIVIFWFYDGKKEEDEVITKALYKKMSEIALTVNFRREPVSSSTLITWILRHFSKEKINVDRHVAVHLCQTVGNSMTDLKNEIDKLIDYLRFENRDTLEKADVDFICIKSTTAQLSDISNSALSGDFVKAAKALEALRENSKENVIEPIPILGTISKAVRDICIVDSYIKIGTPPAAIAKTTDIPEFAIKRYSTILANRSRDFRASESFTSVCAKLCIEYDKKLKSSRTDGYELLLELIFKLSYAGKTAL